MKDTQRTTDFDTLKVYKEKGKVIISKRSKFLGVVYLDNMEEVRKVGAFLYRLIIEEDMKKYGNKKSQRKTK